MSFSVEPQALRTFGTELGTAADAADTATGYLGTYATFGWHQKGLINHLQPAHDQFVGELTSALEHLTVLLDKSRTELANAAAYYEKTDHTAAGKIDASYPQTPRASLPGRADVRMSSGRPDQVPGGPW